ncbi:unnamed protein product [Mytilus coruscus]|uniref:Uncharacterized protein n=1 Tax=Mytilus coruscus TaxID=42192 RepID=A0A6J8EDQ6_MYTCO|nr:unnamed protein product [Mytilus coruscus]
MASQIDDDPESRTLHFTDDDHSPTTSQQSGKGVDDTRIPKDFRDSQTHESESDDDDMSSMSIDTLIRLQHKKMKYMQKLTEHLGSKSDSVSDSANKNITAQHDSTCGTKRSHCNDVEDNISNKHLKVADDPQHDTESVDDLDKLVCSFENAESDNLDKSDNVTDDEDHNEVNELMDETSEFYNDSEETSAAIEESLAKSVNTSLRSKIPDSKFKEIKLKYKRPENCQSLMIPSVNEEVWGEKHAMVNAIRSRDLKLQKIMGYVIKGMIPAIETTNDILKAALKKNTFEPTKNLRKMTDGIRMFAASYTQLNQNRKENFKPIMVGKFKKLTYTNNSVSDQLFGDDLQKKIEDIQKSKRISAKGFTGFTDKPSTSGYNYNQNSAEGYNNNKTGNGKSRFLDQRNSFPNKRG